MEIFEYRASIIIYNIIQAFEDDKIFILPANICSIVPSIFLKANKKFEFIDISNETLCLDFNETYDRIKKEPQKYTGLLFSHTYGVEINVTDFFRSIKKLKEEIFTIDDKCLCIPNLNGILPPYTDLVLYSTGYSKIIEIGWGGYGLFNDVSSVEYKNYELEYNANDLNDLQNQFRIALDQKKKFKYKDSNWLGGTKNYNEFAKYKKEVYGKIDSVLKLKNQINNIYYQLPKEIVLNDKYNYWRFNIIVKNKQQLIKNIFRNGLFASSHYPSLAGIFDNHRAPFAEKLHKSIINLFNDFRFNEKKAQQIVEIVKKHIQIQYL